MKKTIVIESMFLYQYDNPNNGITVGGSQRYSIDIGKVFYEKGYNVVFLTKANVNSEVEFEGWAKIISFNSSYGTKGNYNFSKRVYEYCNKINATIACYSDFEIGYPYCFKNSFAIQHGISWDGPKNLLLKNLLNVYYMKATKSFNKIICVDTNFINWVRERNNELATSGKLKYIPNYADEEIFDYNYREYSDDNKEEIILFYPRRFVKHRGFEIFMDMCSQLTNEGYNVKALLAFEKFNRNEFEKKYTQYKNINYEIVHPRFGEISKYYKKAFLTYIPTIYSEGTSLSAIEAIASGCPVIVSDVGGLGNIVIQGYNGFIVQPNTKEFISITKELYNNRIKRNEMAINCKNVGKVLSKSRWEEEVFKAIRTIIE